MKIAVICGAYLGSAKGVELLSQYFAPLHADIWLHVDVATNAAEYQALAASTPSIRLVSPRLRCYWGGFNGARAVLDAASAARAFGRYDRYLYMTEDSVPLRPVSELAAHLASDSEYIDIGDAPAWIRARYDGYYCWDCDAMCPRIHDYENWIVTPQMELQIARLAKLRTRGKFKLSSLKHGGAYWALSAAAMDALLERDRTDEYFRESFEFSAIPEEQYYHTILADAGVAPRAAPFLLMDFSKDPRPFLYRHRSELVELQREAHLFARKIDFQSVEIVNFVRGLARG